MSGVSTQSAVEFSMSEVTVYSTQITWHWLHQGIKGRTRLQKYHIHCNRNQIQTIKMRSTPVYSKTLDKRFSLSDSERRFRKACDQIVLLNQKLGAVQKRYKSAKNDNNRSFRYNYRLKLAVIEGVRNMYYDYAYAKADEVAKLRRELFNESVEIVSGSDSEYISDEE